MSSSRSPTIAGPQYFSVAEVTQLIELKKKKYTHFDCEVHSAASFQEMTHALVQNQSDYSNPRRFQVALYHTGQLRPPHWMAIDIVISQRIFYIFIIDAALDKYIPNTLKLLPADSSIEVTTCCKELHTHDAENCSVYTLNHIFNLAKMNADELYSRLIKLRVSKQQEVYKNLFELHPLNLPAVLVKNAQSWSFLQNYINHNSSQEYAKEINSLVEYLKSPKANPTDTTINKELLINQSIFRKKEKYRDRLNREIANDLISLFACNGGSYQSEIGTGNQHGKKKGKFVRKHG